MRRADFSYELPPQLIAQAPLAQRSASRLLVCDGATGQLQDRRFRDLPSLLEPGDLLVFNDTRVLPARVQGRKPTGGAVEILLERVLAGRRFLAQARASKGFRPGSTVELPGGHRAVACGRAGDLFEFELDADVDRFFDTHGTTPLPPYITRDVSGDDRQRYQTVYASVPGAVAAPTAGLHFDEDVLAGLARRGVASARLTLHIGAGTFQPLRADDIADHRMHPERVTVSQAVVEAVSATRRRGGRVVAVGTTAVRSLEAAALGGSLRTLLGETDLYVRPGFSFRVVDALLTNFHLPESTLLVLVCAFAGRDKVLAAYRHAVAQGYRFYSYGDAMLLTPDPAVLGPRKAA